MLRRQGPAALLPPSGEMARARGTSGFPPAPGAQGGWDSQTLGSCVLCRGNVAVEGIKDGKHFPLLGISLQLRHHHSCGSPGRSKGRFQKGRAPASLRAVRVEGTTALLRRAKGFGPLAAGGASFFTPRAAAIPPQDGYLRSVPQAGNAASGRSHTCTRQDSRDPRSRPRGPHAADSAP